MKNTRTRNAVVTLAVGLALNISLGVLKFVAGLLAGSNSVTSDGINNLSDAAVSVVTIISTVLAGRSADHDHPYGHGRYEYIATLLLGAVIIAVGAEVLFGGIERSISPEPVEHSALMFAALGVSIAVKLIMAVMYVVRGRAARSDTMRAAAVDSFSDAAVTTAVLICAMIEMYTGFIIDGYASIAVSVVILVMGLRIVKRTVSRLLGERPDAALFAEVTRIITSCPLVISVHDLMINDYGETYKTAEADAVFDSRLPFTEVHGACDAIEREVREVTGVRLCLHADPLQSDDERLAALRERVDGAVAAFGATAHDIEIHDDENTVTLDIAVTSDKCPTDEMIGIVSATVRAMLPSFTVNVGIDHV